MCSTDKHAWLVHGVAIGVCCALLASVHGLHRKEDPKTDCISPFSIYYYCVLRFAVVLVLEPFLLCRVTALVLGVAYFVYFAFFATSCQGIGERCFDEGMYEAARLLFKNIHNNAKLALCLVHLGQYREAVEAATKANAVNTWKQV